jgi:cytochrome c oxidase subunit IV
MTGEEGPKPEPIVTGGEHAEEAAEAIHLPGPSYLPIVVALGLTAVVTGVVISWFITGAGLIVTVIAVWRWIRETREEISELPLDH